MPKLTLSGTVGAEIRSAIEAGKEVSFHEKAISAHGWSGQGYIIVDPETGAGAYLIEGKGNGGVLLDGEWVELVNTYLRLHGSAAWDIIRTDRRILEAEAGRYIPAYRNAEHFLYAYQRLYDDYGLLGTIVLTEGYWLLKAILNFMAWRSFSPYKNSTVTWEQLMAGLYGLQCVAFGCVGIQDY